MANYLLIILILNSFFIIETHARVQINSYLPTQSPPDHHSHGMMITQPETFINCLHGHRETQKAGGHGSTRSAKYEEIKNGRFTAPAPSSSVKQSPIKAIVVILILGLISSGAVAIIRTICNRGQNVGPNRPTSEESEPRPIEEGAHHFELTFCKCNNVALFTLPDV